MDLLFKRAQDQQGVMGYTTFKLWGKVEFDEEEAALIKRYDLADAVLIVAIQPTLLRKSCFVGIAAFIVLLMLSFFVFMWHSAAIWIALIGGGGTGYWYFNEHRETIFVRDLIHGRHFKCDSVVELARKEAWLETVCAYLRQVMESAKHWDGETHLPIKALPKDEARQVILRGL